MSPTIETTSILKKVATTSLAIATMSFGFAANANAADLDYAIKRGGNEATRAATKLLKKERAEDAAHIYQGVIRKGGRKALMKIAYTNLCAAESMMGNQQAAITACDEALALDSGYWQALVNRGHARYLSGDKAAALSDYKAAQKAEPDEDTITAAITALENDTLASR
ncbi:MAG: hypothetical protein PVF65_04775 [Sphingomonadales bacterium]|jgi:tetratricopeptide (TPR) repeat protein